MLETISNGRASLIVCPLDASDCYEQTVHATKLQALVPLRIVPTLDGLGPALDEVLLRDEARRTQPGSAVLEVEGAARGAAEIMALLRSPPAA